MNRITFHPRPAMSMVVMATIAVFSAGTARAQDTAQPAQNDANPPAIQTPAPVPVPPPSSTPDQTATPEIAPATPADTVALQPAPYNPQPKLARDAPQSQYMPYEALMQDVASIDVLRGDDLERTYLEFLMDHHQSGIDLAQMALQHSSNPRIQSQAQRIIRDNQQQIGLMRAYIQAWYGYNRTAKPEARNAEILDHLATLSGRDFDRAFTQAMTDHETGAIFVSRTASRFAPRTESRRLAQAVTNGLLRSRRALRVAYRGGVA
jgi:uncharacterized protein (DUF305 family)